jgi:O-antigen ligase
MMVGMGRMLTTKALAPESRPAEPLGRSRQSGVAMLAPPPLPKLARPSFPADSTTLEGSLNNPIAKAIPNPIRTLAFNTCMLMLFVRMGFIPELLYAVTGRDTYVLYLVAPPALLGALMTGAFPRTFRMTAARFWTAFFGWMILATPMSYWVGGSLEKVIGYARVDFAMLFVVGGIAASWNEVRRMCLAMSAACVSTLAAVAKYAIVENGRLSMDDVSGTIGNSNDLAAHVLLLLPFAGYLLQDKKIPYAIRIFMWPVMGYGVWTIFRTGSRGALIALAIMTLFILARASLTQRLIAAVAAVGLAMSLPVILPGSTMDRLNSLFGGVEHREAEESADSREYLLQKSIEYTKRFPIFGVGPEQFPNFEGNESKSAGKVGNWHNTHNTYTQVSSENGIPALIFFVAGIVSAFRLVSKVYRRARDAKQKEMANVAFYYMLSMVGFMAASIFLSHAYSFRFPSMIGLGIAIYLCAQPILFPTLNQQRR